MTQRGSPIDVRPLFPEERAALLDLLADLSDTDWQRPTVCPGWSVHDVALHLLGGDVNVLAGGRDAFHGPPTNPTLDLSDWATLVAYINDRNDAWLNATRRVSPRLVRELLRFTGERLVAYLRTVDLDALGIPVDWAGPGPAPAWLHIAREYTERWVHQQHIRDAVDKPGLTERRFFFPVLDAFARALPHTLRETEAAEGSRVRLVITGEAGGAWMSEHVGGSWIMIVDDAEDAEATVTMDQDLAWRLFTKGVTPTAAAREITVTGNPRFGQPLTTMVSILA